MTIFIYAALLGIFFLYQSVEIIAQRYREKISIGDGNSTRLRAFVRAHANFAEYVPFALLLILFLEMNAVFHTLVIDGLGAALVIGRMCHYTALTAKNGDMSRLKLRAVGMGLTFAVIGFCAIALLYVHFFA